MEARPAGYAGSGKGWVHRHEAKRAETRQFVPEKVYFILTAHQGSSANFLGYLVKSNQFGSE
jgi:hypothetical protein